MNDTNLADPSAINNLVQTTATFCAVLAATYSAFFFFFQEKISVIDESIYRNKTEIRNLLASTQLQFSMPSGLFLPDVLEKFRDSKGLFDSFSVAAAAQAEYIFHDLKLKEISSAADQSSAWKSKAFLWCYSVTVNAMTEGLGSKHIDGLPGVFPAKVDGLGFEEWSQGFRRIVPLLSFVVSDSDHLVDDYTKAIFAQYANSKKAFYMASIAAAQSNIQQIGSLLSTISALEESKTRFTSKNSRGFSPFFVLMFLAILTGVIVPLVMQGIGFRFSTSFTIAAVLATLAFTGGATWQGYCEFKEKPKPSTRDSLLARFVPDFQSTEAALMRSMLQQFGWLDLSNIMLLQGSPDLNELSGATIKAQATFLGSATKYNELLLSLNEKILSEIKGKPALSSHPAISSSSRLFTPLGMVDESNTQSIEKSVNQADLAISIETLKSRSSRVELTFASGDENVRRLAISEIDQVRRAISSNETYKGLLFVRAACIDALSALESAVKAEVR